MLAPATLALFPGAGMAEATGPAESGVEEKADEPAKTKAEKDKSDFELRPRWRVQYDVGKLSVSDHVSVPDDGWNDMLRRAFIGVDAKFGGGWSARVEGEFATEDPEFTDLYLAYANGGLTVTAGQQKMFQSLDDMTSDLQSSFAERAAFVQAFNFSRRTGISAAWKRGDILLQGAVGTDPMIALNDAKDNSIGVDGRVIWAPKMGGTQLHLAGSAHWRDRNDLADTGLRYRSRPAIRTTETRFVASPSLRVERELSYGLEAAAIRGRFHAVGEAYWLNASVPGRDDPLYWGGYGEVGVFLTNDTRPYKGGAFGTISPKKPFGNGGIGAVQLNARYDLLDLNSRGLVGGKQRSLQGSLIWIPIENIRFSATASRLRVKDAVIAGTGGDRDYSADSLLFRFQIHY